MKRTGAVAAVLGVAASVVLAGAGAGGPAAAGRIASLCKRLGDGEYGSMGACNELIAIGQPAVPHLLKALKDKRPQARWWAVAAVCRLAPEEGYPAVVDVLANDPNAFVRSTAVYYLRHFAKKGKDVWPEVERALADKNPEVGRWALRLMVEDQHPEVDKKLREVLAKGSGELRSYALSHIRDMADRGKAYLPLVRELLSTADPRIRYDALHTSVVLMDSGQLELLRKTYESDKDPLVQEGALRCATVIPEPPVESIALFVLGLRNENEKVRTCAGKLLRKGCKQYFGFDAKQPLPIREAAITKWEDWYQANRAKLQWHSDLRKFLLPGIRKKEGPAKEGEAGERAGDRPGAGAPEDGR